MTTIFQNPAQQIMTMEERINKELNKDVAEEILAYAEIKTEQKYQQIFNILVKRLDRINEIYTTETNSKQQYLERMQKFLNITNPSYLSDELKRTLFFSEIEREYKQIYEFFSKTDYGKVFLRYKFDSKALKSMQGGILADVHLIQKSLENYASVYAEHIKVMKGIKDSAGAKIAFRIGTKVVGSLLLGPLGSIAGGALAKAITNDNNAIVHSYSQVLNAWSEYLEKLDEFLLNLKLRYNHILLTLVGGLFVRVSQDLNVFDVGINSLFLEEYGIQYGIKLEKLDTYRVWMQKTTEGILSKMKEGNFQAALRGSGELYSYIDNHPVLKFELYSNDKSFLYMAYLYRFAAIASFANTSKNKLEIVHQLFTNQTLLLQDEDLTILGVPTQLELATFSVRQWLLHNELETKANVFPDLLLKLIKRYNTIGYYEGEHPKDTFINFLLYVGKYLVIKHKQKKYDALTEEYGIPITQVKEIINFYRKNNKIQQDEITKFSKVLIGSARFWSILRFLKKPVFISSLLSFILIIIVVQTKDTWTPLFSHFSEKKEAPVTHTQLNPKMEVLTVQVAMANVRSTPNLKGSVVTSLVKGQHYTVLARKKDEEGILWYKIETSSGVFGWISSKIVKVEKQ